MSDVYGKAFEKVPLEDWYIGIDFMQGVQTERLGTDTVYDVAKAHMMEQATKGMPPALFAGSPNRWLKGSYEKFLTILEMIGARRVVQTFSSIGEPGNVSYVWRDGCIHLNTPDLASEVAVATDEGLITDDFSDDEEDDDDSSVYVDPEANLDEEFSFTFVGRDQKNFDLIYSFNKANAAPFRQRAIRQNGRAYMLAEIPQLGLQLVSLGIAGEKFIGENYEPDVVEGFNRIVDDFTREVPRGRLAILEGAPGCGKTHMTQAIMKACSRSKFVIIPPKMLKDLEDPGFILTFLQQNSSSDGEPLILILEDADQCLSSRTADNMSSISAVLNLSDGIVGKLLNLRILATTNTPIETVQNGKTVQLLDKAALRKGRLSAHVKVGPVAKKQAMQIFHRLTTPTAAPVKKFDDRMTLGDIYDAANEWIELNPSAMTVNDLKNLK